MYAPSAAVIGEYSVLDAKMAAADAVLRPENDTIISARGFPPSFSIL